MKQHDGIKYGSSSAVQIFITYTEYITDRILDAL